MRLEQSLEVTDALWDLVPVVVAAGEQHDAQPAADATDLPGPGRRLTSERRSHVRTIADKITDMQETALAERDLDDSALAALTYAR